MAHALTAFVTGGTGFLGLNLVDQLTQAGWHVVALHRSQSNLTYLKRFAVDLVEGAVEDRASLERAMPPEVDAVFHVAADVSLWSRNNLRQTRCNVEGTRNLVASALARKARKFIHTSTSGVYGLQPEPFDETAPKLGRDSWVNYMKTKAEAEEEVLKGIERGLDAVLLNPANIVGRYDLHGWGRLMRLALDGKLLRVPPGSSSFCHGSEVARADIAAVSRGRTGENYLLGGPNADYVELITTAAAVAGQKMRTRSAPKPVLRFAARVGGLIARFTEREPMLTLESTAYLCSDLICRSDKAAKELNYATVPLATMVEDWYRWSTTEGLIGSTLDA